MSIYILKRLAQLLIVLLGASFIAFTLLYFSPGDPASRILGHGSIAIDPAMVAAAQAQMGLDKPFIERYGIWLLNIVQGDFGMAYSSTLPVSVLLMRAAPPTLILALLSVAVSTIISIPVGLLLAWNKDSFADKTVRSICSVLASLPGFLIALLLLYIFGLKLRLLPLVGSITPRGAILPVATLAIAMSAKYIRQFRAEFIKRLQGSHVYHARMRGVKTRHIIFNHVLRDSLPGLITILAYSMGALLVGTVITETIFGWPGMGTLLLSSLENMDYPLATGAIFCIAVVVALINLACDLSYIALDPRTAMKRSNA